MLGSAEVASARGQARLGGPESGGTSTAIGKQFASVVEQDDTVAQQPPALPSGHRANGRARPVPRPPPARSQAAIRTAPSSRPAARPSPARGDAAPSPR